MDRGEELPEIFQEPRIDAVRVAVNTFGYGRDQGSSPIYGRPSHHSKNDWSVVELAGWWRGWCYMWILVGWS
jgi:hypothetical protein